MRSKFLSLNSQDLLKGLLVAVIMALMTGFYELLQSGAAFNWATLKPVVFAAIAAGLSYLIKNLFTNSTGQPLKLEKK